MAMLARLMNSLPIRLLPESARRGFLHAVTRIPHWLVGRGLRPGRVRDRVAAAIANQVNHFDRLGLDIGYIYEDGAIISDHNEIAMPDDPVSQYIPSTHPGAHFPIAGSTTTEAESQLSIMFPIQSSDCTLPRIN